MGSVTLEHYPEAARSREYDWIFGLVCSSFCFLVTLSISCEKGQDLNWHVQLYSRNSNISAQDTQINKADPWLPYYGEFPNPVDQALSQALESDFAAILLPKLQLLWSCCVTHWPLIASGIAELVAI